jgi:hypothetical protein
VLKTTNVATERNFVVTSGKFNVIEMNTSENHAWNSISSIPINLSFMLVS